MTATRPRSICTKRATSTAASVSHFHAAQAIAEYIARAELKSGPLFRPRLNPRSKKLSNRAMDPATLYRLIQRYLEALPGTIKEIELLDGSKTP
jgi:hypothetical protein